MKLSKLSLYVIISLENYLKLGKRTFKFYSFFRSQNLGLVLCLENYYCNNQEIKKTVNSHKI